MLYHQPGSDGALFTIFPCPEGRGYFYNLSVNRLIFTILERPYYMGNETIVKDLKIHSARFLFTHLQILRRYALDDFT
jgi:hypothetical protein